MTPSSEPTIAPSLNPTNINVSIHSAILVVSLETFSVPMDDKEKRTFESTVKDFITKSMPNIDNIDIHIKSVEITSQFRSKGATNGLLSSRDGNVHDRKEERSLTSTGLMIEMLITGEVSYGAPPENFSFRNAIIPVFENDFDVLLNDLENTFSVLNAIETPADDGTSQDEAPRGGKMLIMYLSLGLGAGCMILVAAFIVVHKKRKASRHQELQDHNVFNGIKPSLDTIGLDSPAVVDGESRWSWVDPAENDIKKDLEDPYGLASSMYDISRSNSYSQNQKHLYSFNSKSVS
jgi:hypothetical protein